MIRSLYTPHNASLVIKISSRKYLKAVHFPKKGGSRSMILHSNYLKSN